MVLDMFTLASTSSDVLPLLEFLLKFIGGIGAFWLFVIGFRRYKKDQTWKRNEFVATEVKEFNADPMCRNAMYMLDWPERYIYFFPDQPDYARRFAKVDRAILRRALQYHELRGGDINTIRFTDDEVAIRDSFDQFFSYFERFYQFVEAGLITPAELEPYLNYWINLITFSLEPDLRETLYHYVNRYQYTGTASLFKSFGKDISPTSDIMDTLNP